MLTERCDSSNARGVWYRVFLRSFFLETLWNYQKMQNVGFVFAMYPALKKLFSGGDALQAAVSRNLELVNTHPSMGPLLMGLTLLLEKERDCAEDVMTYRRAFMTALAAQGDHIFWGVIKPLAAVVGAAATLVSGTFYAGPLLALLAYNVPNMAIRVWGFGAGWSRGLRVLSIFQSPSFHRALSLARDATACGLGSVVGVIICDIFSVESSRVSLVIQVVEVWAILSAGAGAFFLLYRRVPLGLVMFLAAFGSLLFLASI
ncbi:MAG: PTS system mannose/fructose/sorbose family transporter subunit IID [Desulfomonilaceae bacterium]